MDNLKLRYFTASEFKCKGNLESCDKCDATGYNMDVDFITDLDEARHRAGIPFRLSSAYRCRAFNEICGGRISSEHTKGKAVDILYRDNNEKFKILRALMSVGFNRIGMSESSKFIHVDSSKEKAQETMWGYNY